MAGQGCIAGTYDERRRSAGKHPAWRRHVMPSRPLHFRSRIHIQGIKPYVLIAPRQALRLRRQGRGPIPVRVQLNGKLQIRWRINLMPPGDGSFTCTRRKRSVSRPTLTVCDLVQVRVELDREYKGGPMHPMPRWFSLRSGANSRTSATWRRLSPSRQKEILRYFAGLKSAAARARNADRALEVLAGRRARFMDE
jgi:hypothetical protein